MRPPQARPTAQASSSDTPNSSRRGLPSFIAAWASRTTAPSMHPPDTEPIIAPFSSTARWLPAGRGEDPQVETTVASATPLPSERQREAWSRTSSSLIDPLAPSSRRLTRRYEGFGQMRGYGTAQSLGQGVEAFQIVHRAELVHIGQNHARPDRLRFIEIIAQQRVEPDKSLAGSFQPRHLGGKARTGFAIKAIGDQQHDRALRENTP